ncbi:MAG: PIN domain-containing protein [Veillonellales bacterium]|jgi:predicted nucleic acid-binding protein
MVGLDTGFFIALMKSDPAATRFWSNLSKSNALPIVSILTIGELLYITLRFNEPEKGKRLVENIYIAAEVLPVDREIVEKAAAFKAGRGMPYVDSIILATFILAGCKEIHTTDKNHFAGIKNKGLKIIFYDNP